MKNIKSKLFNLLRRISERCNGVDELNKYLIIATLAISLVNVLFRSLVLTIITYVFDIIFLFRFFSTNKVARRIENRTVTHFIAFFKMKWQYRKTHKVFMCKNCSQFIRIPLKQGKVEFTCPKCGTVHTKRT